MVFPLHELFPHPVDNRNKVTGYKMLIADANNFNIPYMQVNITVPTKASFNIVLRITGEGMNGCAAFIVVVIG